MERDVKRLFRYDLQKDHARQCTEYERDKAVDLVFPHEYEECLDVWNRLLSEFLDLLDECVPVHSVCWLSGCRVSDHVATGVKTAVRIDLAFLVMELGLFENVLDHLDGCALLDELLIASEISKWRRDMLLSARHSRMSCLSSDFFTVVPYDFFSLSFGVSFDFTTSLSGLSISLSALR